MPIHFPVSKSQPLPVTAASNVTGIFREAFETYVPGQLWTESKAAGDIVMLDGNSVGASYLVISKSPFTQNTTTFIESVVTFDMPADIAAGLHMSQRTVGQGFTMEAVSTETPMTAPADVAISSISQTTTTLSVTTATPHGLKPGMRIGIRGVTQDSRLNYPVLVVASANNANVFTCTAGPMGTIPSLTVGPFTSGFVYVRSAMGWAPNGTSMVLNNSTATQASFYVKSLGGDVHPMGGTPNGNHSITIATSASVVAINAAATYAFQPSSEYRLNLMADRVQWSDSSVDTTTETSNRALRTQVVPDPGKTYKLRFRAVNHPSHTVPVAQIVSVSKSGTTTATVTTDVAHGLTTGDYVCAYGTRDTTNFPMLTTPTVVASVVSATQFTVVWGSASTVTSYGGFVSRANGGNGQFGVVTVNSVNTVSASGGLLTLINYASWTGLAVGDYVNLYGFRVDPTGASLGVDGVYRVRDFSTTTLVLEPIDTTPVPADFAATNASGGVIRRTDLRISFVRIFDFERQRVEMLARPSGDASATVPVSMKNQPAVIGPAARAASVSGNPVVIGARAATASPTAVANNQVVDPVATTIGALIHKPYAIPELAWNANLSLTTTTAQAAAAAAGTGLKRHITALQAINTGTAVDLIILDGATERWRITLPQNVPVSITFPTELLTTANAALNFNLSAAGTVRVCAQGYTAP